MTIPVVPDQPFWPPIAFVVGRHGFLAGTDGEGQQVHRLAALGAGQRQQCALGARLLIEIIENGVAVDQHLAIVQHQRRQATQRRVFANLQTIRQDAERFVGEWYVQQMQADADAADERRHVATDQFHRQCSRGDWAVHQP